MRRVYILDAITRFSNYSNGNSIGILEYGLHAAVVKHTKTSPLKFALRAAAGFLPCEEIASYRPPLSRRQSRVSGASRRKQSQTAQIPTRRPGRSDISDEYAKGLLRDNSNRQCDKIKPG